MLKRLSPIFLALALGLCGASPAAAWLPHGTGASPPPTVPDIIPGSSPPVVNASTSAPVTVTATVNNITPTSHGNPSDNGYALRGLIRPTGIPEVEVGRPGVSGVLHVGWFVKHPPTNAEKAAGLVSNVVSVDMRCDGGSWFTIGAPTNNPDASGQLDWNATVTSSNFADGLHQCDARGTPATGPDIIAQGPMTDEYGNGYELVKTYSGSINDTQGGTGNILTVPANPLIVNYSGGGASDPMLSIGMSVATVGAAPNTFIDGDHTTNSGSCTASTGAICSGVGRAGTYHVTQSADAGLQITGSITNAVLTVTSVTGPLGLINTGTSITGAGITLGTQTTGVNFTGSISGTTLNVTAVAQGLISPGLAVGGSGVSGSTTITAYAGGSGGTGNYTVNNSQTVASEAMFLGGTGGGGVGTYPVTVAQTVASESMRAGLGAMFNFQRSFYFFTNYNGTLYRPLKFVSLSGTDNTSCGSSAAPCLTLPYTQALMASQDTGNAFHKGKYGGVICLMNGSTYGYGVGTTSRPESSVGITVYQGADQAPCSLGSDPGNPTAFISGGTDRQYYPLRMMWRYLSFSGDAAPTNGSGGDAWYLMADHVNMKHSKMGQGGLLSSGGQYCVDSISWFGTDGACSGSVMTRGNTDKYLSTDCHHDVGIVIDDSCDYMGPEFFWAQGTSTVGSNVITNISFPPSDLAGYDATTIYVANNVTPQAASQIGVFNAAGPIYTECFPTPGAGTDQNKYVGAVTATTITVIDSLGNPVNATSTCTNGQLGWPNSHSDLYQYAGVNIIADVIIYNNNLGGALGGVQGLFPETQNISGFYVGFNTFHLNPLSGASALLVGGGNENWMSEFNSFTGAGGMHQDNQATSSGETYIKDQCQGTSAMLPTIKPSTNIRALQATSSICYTTTTP